MTRFLILAILFMFSGIMNAEDNPGTKNDKIRIGRRFANESTNVYDDIGLNPYIFCENMVLPIYDNEVFVVYHESNISMGCMSDFISPIFDDEIEYVMVLSEDDEYIYQGL